MSKTNKLISTFAIILSSIVGFHTKAQQLKVPALSPTATLKQSVALSEITIDYSRPSARGRVAYGDLVPFGKVWRTGANASTKITFGEDVKLEGNPVPAGTYAFYTIPDKDEWTIILNKNITLWGSDGYKQEEDYLRFKVKTSALSNKVESFTFNINDLTPTSAIIEMVWEQTRVAFMVTVDIDAKVMKNIDVALATDKRPYYQAATYYYDNDKDMKQALTWVNKAAENNPKAYWVLLLKAKIQVKLKDITGANATAQKVITMAKADNDDSYQKQAQQLIDSNKKK
jgi:tetratricopeptide (TPR) repeat protein